MYRALIIEANDTEYWIDGVAVSQVFGAYDVPPPDESSATISTQFQIAVNTCGIVLPVINAETVQMTRFIPPYQIKNVFLFVSKDKPKYLDVAKVIRENKNADL